MDERERPADVVPTCPRCGGNDFVSAEVRRDPVTFEVIHQLLCVKKECQVVLGVMTLASLAKRAP